MKYIDQYQGMEVSFWEIFPVFKDQEPFRKLYKEDRSEAKNKSSKVMWYLVLAKDIDSEYYSLDKEEKLEVLMDIAGFDIDKFLEKKTHKLPELELEFEIFIDTPLSADVRALEDKLLERTRFIKKTPYTLDEMISFKEQYNEETGEVENIPCKPYLVKGTAPQLDKMFTETKKIHDEIRSLREALRSEQTEKGKGGKEDSFIEG